MKNKSKVSFRLRTVPDNQQLVDWHQSDPDHQHSDSSFFTDTEPGREQLTVEKDGEPIFYVTLENVARVHIQFNPHGSKLKNLKSLILGFTFLRQALKERSYKEMIFDSRFSPLIRFCQSALGFFKLDKDYSTRL